MTLHLMLCLALLASEPDHGPSDSTGVSVVPPGWDFGYSSLIQADAVGSWEDSRPQLDSTFMDVSFSVHALSREVDLLAVAAAGSEPSGEAFLRRGRASIKWPGTPWVGGGVYFADRQPFIPGLRRPVLEWGAVDADSIAGFGVSGGGILGFRAYYLLQTVQGDTLEQFDVYSPWMGFAGLDYHRVEIGGDDSLWAGGLSVNALEIRADFRYVAPRVVITGGDGEPGRWTLSGDLRDYSPLDTPWGSIELVPGIRFAGDSSSLVTDSYVPGQRVMFLGAYLDSRRYMLSAGMEGMVDLESDSLSGFSTTAGMVTPAGVTWDMMLNIFADGDYYGSLAAGTSDSFASAGLMVEVVNDSTRLTGSASYTPRRDVCAELAVSGDLDESLQPACSAALSSSLGPVRGLLAVDWTYGSEPVFRLSLRGLLR